MSIFISSSRRLVVSLPQTIAKITFALSKFCMVAFFCVFWTTTMAEDAEQSSSAGQSTPMAIEGQIVEIVLALIAILLLIWVIAWFVKRFTGIGPQGGQHIKTIAVMPVGTRERIAVIEVGGRQIVVGITPQQITTLLELDQPLDISASGGEFARKLQTLLNRNENEAKGEANSVQKQS